MKDLNELSQSIAVKLDELKKLSADPIQTGITQEKDDNNNRLMHRLDMLHNAMSDIYSYASHVHSMLNNHTSMASHLPPIKSTAQMNKALKALGMDEDYKCEPKTIYASKGNMVIEVEQSK